MQSFRTLFFSLFVLIFRVVWSGIWKRLFVCLLVSQLILSPVHPVQALDAFAMAPLQPISTPLTLTQPLQPPVLQGVLTFPDDPFRFDFVFDPGDLVLDEDQSQTEALRLVRYFLAALAIPEKDLWVNLSPHEAQRMIPQTLGETHMGRDLLVLDYLLKNLSASLMSPETEVGRQFWQKMYQRLHAAGLSTDITTESFNKIWVVPDIARVYEHQNAALIVDSRLRVLLEQDYLATTHSRSSSTAVSTDTRTRPMTASVIREHLLPLIEEEINTGSQFARLRQMYQSMILAYWFKSRLRDSLMGQIYADQENVSSLLGEGTTDPQDVYQRYLNAYRDGIYDQVKEEYDPLTQALTLKRYFAGGGDFGRWLRDSFVVHGTAEEVQGILSNRSQQLSIDVQPDEDDSKKERSSLEIFDRLKPDQAWKVLVQEVQSEGDTWQGDNPALEFLFGRRKISIPLDSKKHYQSLMKELVAIVNKKMPLKDIEKNFDQLIIHLADNRGPSKLYILAGLKVVKKYSLKLNETHNTIEGLSRMFETANLIPDKLIRLLEKNTDFQADPKKTVLKNLLSLLQDPEFVTTYFSQAARQMDEKTESLDWWHELSSNAKDYVYNWIVLAAYYPRYMLPVYMPYLQFINKNNKIGKSKPKEYLLNFPISWSTTKESVTDSDDANQDEQNVYITITAAGDLAVALTEETEFYAYFRFDPNHPNESSSVIFKDVTDVVTNEQYQLQRDKEIGFAIEDDQNDFHRALGSLEGQDPNDVILYDHLLPFMHKAYQYPIETDDRTKKKYIMMGPVRIPIALPDDNQKTITLRLLPIPAIKNNGAIDAQSVFNQLNLVEIHLIDNQYQPQRYYLAYEEKMDESGSTAYVLHNANYYEFRNSVTAPEQLRGRRSEGLMLKYLFQYVNEVFPEVMPLSEWISLGLTNDEGFKSTVSYLHDQWTEAQKSFSNERETSFVLALYDQFHDTLNSEKSLKYVNGFPHLWYVLITIMSGLPDAPKVFAKHFMDFLKGDAIDINLLNDLSFEIPNDMVETNSDNIRIIFGRLDYDETNYPVAVKLPDGLSASGVKVRWENNTLWVSDSSQQWLLEYQFNSNWAIEKKNQDLFILNQVFLTQPESPSNRVPVWIHSAGSQPYTIPVDRVYDPSPIHAATKDPYILASWQDQIDFFLLLSRDDVTLENIINRYSKMKFPFLVTDNQDDTDSARLKITSNLHIRLPKKLIGHVVWVQILPIDLANISTELRVYSPYFNNGFMFGLAFDAASQKMDAPILNYMIKTDRDQFDISKLVVRLLDLATPRGEKYFLESKMTIAWQLLEKLSQTPNEYMKTIKSLYKKAIKKQTTQNPQFTVEEFDGSLQTAKDAVNIFGGDPNDYSDIHAIVEWLNNSNEILRDVLEGDQPKNAQNQSIAVLKRSYYNKHSQKRFSNDPVFVSLMKSLPSMLIDYARRDALAFDRIVEMIHSYIHQANNDNPSTEGLMSLKTFSGMSVNAPPGRIIEKEDKKFLELALLNPNQSDIGAIHVPIYNLNPTDLIITIKNTNEFSLSDAKFSIAYFIDAQARGTEEDPYIVPSWMDDELLFKRDVITEKRTGGDLTPQSQILDFYTREENGIVYELPFDFEGVIAGRINPFRMYHEHNVWNFKEKEKSLLPYFPDIPEDLKDSNIGIIFEIDTLANGVVVPVLIIHDLTYSKSEVYHFKRKENDLGYELVKVLSDFTMDQFTDTNLRPRAFLQKVLDDNQGLPDIQCDTGCTDEDIITELNQWLAKPDWKGVLKTQVRWREQALSLYNRSSDKLLRDVINHMSDLELKDHVRFAMEAIYGIKLTPMNYRKKLYSFLYSSMAISYINSKKELNLAIHIPNVQNYINLGLGYKNDDVSFLYLTHSNWVGRNHGVIINVSTTNSLQNTSAPVHVRARSYGVNPRDSGDLAENVIDQTIFVPYSEAKNGFVPLSQLWLATQLDGVSSASLQGYELVLPVSSSDQSVNLTSYLPAWITTYQLYLPVSWLYDIRPGRGGEDSQWEKNVSEVGLYFKDDDQTEILFNSPKTSSLVRFDLNQDFFAAQVELYKRFKAFDLNPDSASENDTFTSFTVQLPENVTYIPLLKRGDDWLKIEDADFRGKELTVEMHQRDGLIIADVQIKNPKTNEIQRKPFILRLDEYGQAQFELLYEYIFSLHQEPNKILHLFKGVSWQGQLDKQGHLIFVEYTADFLSNKKIDEDIKDRLLGHAFILDLPYHFPDVDFRDLQDTDIKITIGKLTRDGKETMVFQLDHKLWPDGARSIDYDTWQNKTNTVFLLPDDATAISHAELNDNFSLPDFNMSEADESSWQPMYDKKRQEWQVRLDEQGKVFVDQSLSGDDTNVMSILANEVLDESKSQIVRIVRVERASRSFLIVDVANFRDQRALYEIVDNTIRKVDVNDQARSNEMKKQRFLSFLNGTEEQLAMDNVMIDLNRHETTGEDVSFGALAGQNISFPIQGQSWADVFQNERLRFHFQINNDDLIFEVFVINDRDERVSITMAPVFFKVLMNPGNTATDEWFEVLNDKEILEMTEKEQRFDAKLTKSSFDDRAHFGMNLKWSLMGASLAALPNNKPLTLYLDDESIDFGPSITWSPPESYRNQTVQILLWQNRDQKTIVTLMPADQRLALQHFEAKKVESQQPITFIPTRLGSDVASVWKAEADSPFAFLKKIKEGDHPDDEMYMFLWRHTSQVDIKFDDISNDMWRALVRLASRTSNKNPHQLVFDDYKEVLGQVVDRHFQSLLATKGLVDSDQKEKILALLKIGYLGASRLSWKGHIVDSDALRLYRYLQMLSPDQRPQTLVVMTQYVISGYSNYQDPVINSVWAAIKSLDIKLEFSQESADEIRNQYSQSPNHSVALLIRDSARQQFDWLFLDRFFVWSFDEPRSMGDEHLSPDGWDMVQAVDQIISQHTDGKDATFWMKVTDENIDNNVLRITEEDFGDFSLNLPPEYQKGFWFQFQTLGGTSAVKLWLAPHLEPLTMILAENMDQWSLTSYRLINDSKQPLRQEYLFEANKSNSEGIPGIYWHQAALGDRVIALSDQVDSDGLLPFVFIPQQTPPAAYEVIGIDNEQMTVEMITQADNIIETVEYSIKSIHLPIFRASATELPLLTWLSRHNAISTGHRSAYDLIGLEFTFKTDDNGHVDWSRFDWLTDDLIRPDIQLIIEDDALMYPFGTLINGKFLLENENIILLLTPQMDGDTKPVRFKFENQNFVQQTTDDGSANHDVNKSLNRLQKKDDKKNTPFQISDDDIVELIPNEKTINEAVHNETNSIHTLQTPMADWSNLGKEKQRFILASWMIQHYQMTELDLKKLSNEKDLYNGLTGQSFIDYWSQRWLDDEKQDVLLVPYILTQLQIHLSIKAYLRSWLGYVFKSDYYSTLDSLAPLFTHHDVLVHKTSASVAHEMLFYWHDAQIRAQSHSTASVMSTFIALLGWLPEASEKNHFKSPWEYIKDHISALNIQTLYVDLDDLAPAGIYEWMEKDVVEKLIMIKKSGVTIYGITQRSLSDSDFESVGEDLSWQSVFDNNHLIHIEAASRDEQAEKLSQINTMNNNTTLILSRDVTSIERHSNLSKVRTISYYDTGNKDSILEKIVEALDGSEDWAQQKTHIAYNLVRAFHEAIISKRLTQADRDEIWEDFQEIIQYIPKSDTDLYSQLIHQTYDRLKRVWNRDDKMVLDSSQYSIVERVDLSRQWERYKVQITYDVLVFANGLIESGSQTDASQKMFWQDIMESIPDLVTSDQYVQMIHQADSTLQKNESKIIKGNLESLKKELSDAALVEYERVLSRPFNRWSKSYFVGPSGAIRAQAILNSIVNNGQSIVDIRTMDQDWFYEKRLAPLWKNYLNQSLVKVYDQFYPGQFQYTNGQIELLPLTPKDLVLWSQGDLLLLPGRVISGAIKSTPGFQFITKAKNNDPSQSIHSLRISHQSEDFQFRVKAPSSNFWVQSHSDPNRGHVVLFGFSNESVEAFTSVTQVIDDGSKTVWVPLDYQAGLPNKTRSLVGSSSVFLQDLWEWSQGRAIQFVSERPAAWQSGIPIAIKKTKAGLTLQLDIKDNENKQQSLELEVHRSRFSMSEKRWTAYEGDGLKPENYQLHFDQDMKGRLILTVMLKDKTIERFAYDTTVSRLVSSSEQVLINMINVLSTPHVIISEEALEPTQLSITKASENETKKVSLAVDSNKLDLKLPKLPESFGKKRQVSAVIQHHPTYGPYLRLFFGNQDHPEWWADYHMMQRSAEAKSISSINLDEQTLKAAIHAERDQKGQLVRLSPGWTWTSPVPIDDQGQIDQSDIRIEGLSDLVGVVPRLSLFQDPFVGDLIGVYQAKVETDDETDDMSIPPLTWLQFDFVRHRLLPAPMEVINRLLNQRFESILMGFLDVMDVFGQPDQVGWIDSALAESLAQTYSGFFTDEQWGRLIAGWNQNSRKNLEDLRQRLVSGDVVSAVVEPLFKTHWGSSTDELLASYLHSMVLKNSSQATIFPTDEQIKKNIEHLINNEFKGKSKIIEILNKFSEILAVDIEGVNKNSLAFHQREDVYHLSQVITPKQGVYVGELMGTGKTRIVAALILKLIKQKEAEQIKNKVAEKQSAVVVVPNSVKEQWKNDFIEIEADNNPIFIHDASGGRLFFKSAPGTEIVSLLNISIKNAENIDWKNDGVDFSIDELTKLESIELKNIDQGGKEITKKVYPIIIVNYEALRANDGDSQVLQSIKALDPNVIAFDEAHMLGNSETVTWEVMHQNFGGVEYRILASGDPVNPSSKVNLKTGFNIQKLWSQLYFLNPDIFPSLEKFNKELLKGVGYRKLVQHMAMIMVRHDPRDLNLPLPHVTPVFKSPPMSTQQKNDNSQLIQKKQDALRKIQQLKSQSGQDSKKTNNTEKIKTLRTQLWTINSQLLSVAAGRRKDNKNYAWQYDGKFLVILEQVLDIMRKNKSLAENDRRHRILILTNYINVAEGIAKALNDIIMSHNLDDLLNDDQSSALQEALRAVFNENSYINKDERSEIALHLNGDIDFNDRVNIVNEFNNNIGPDVIISTVGVGAVGVNFIGANRLIIHDWANTFPSLAQMIGRIARIGQPFKEVTAVMLAADGNEEEMRIIKMLERKGLFVKSIWAMIRMARHLKEDLQKVTERFVEEAQTQESVNQLIKHLTEQLNSKATDFTRGGMDFRGLDQRLDTNTLPSPANTIPEAYQHWLDTPIDHFHIQIRHMGRPIQPMLFGLNEIDLFDNETLQVSRNNT